MAGKLHDMVIGKRSPRRIGTGHENPSTITARIR